jgi:hypothetical protein
LGAREWQQKTIVKHKTLTVLLVNDAHKFHLIVPEFQILCFVYGFFVFLMQIGKKSEKDFAICFYAKEKQTVHFIERVNVSL